MRTLKRLAPPLLCLAAFALVLATAFTSHTDDYGSVDLPPGGKVTLPEGGVDVFVEEAQRDNSSPDLSSPLAFAMFASDGTQVAAEAGEGLSIETDRSQTVGSDGAVAKLDIPAAGDYTLTGGLEGGTQATLTFGRTRFSAVASHWKVLAGLLGAAFVIALIPMREARDGPIENFSRPSAYSGPAPYDG
jgi:hypothetical protein